MESDYSDTFEKKMSWRLPNSERPIPQRPSRPSVVDEPPIGDMTRIIQAITSSKEVETKPIRAELQKLDHPEFGWCFDGKTANLSVCGRDRQGTKYKGNNHSHSNNLRDISR